MVRHFKHSGRRAFLRTLAGTTLTLPLLEYTHGHLWGTARASSNATRRFITVFEHGGTISNMTRGGGQPRRFGMNSAHHGLDLWRPSDPSSELLVPGPIHQPLLPWTDRLLVLEGIDNMAAIEGHRHNHGGHYVSNVTALTAADVTHDEGENSRSLGPSIDQVVAQRLMARQPTPFERIHLEVKPVNGLAAGYGTPYYRAANQPMSGERSPQAAFAALFEGVSGDEPSPEILKLNQKRTSVLSGLRDGYQAFHGRVSSRDQHAIDAHLEHLHALEQQLANPVVCTVPDEPNVGGGGGVDAGQLIGDLQADLLVAAIRCGLTNVANLEIADLLAPWTPNAHLRDQLSFSFNAGHDLGHLAGDVGPSGPKAHEFDDFLTYKLENRQWRMSLVARILEGLDDPNFVEDGGTILDNSVVLVTSEFSSAARHVAHNVPVLLAGSAGGYFRTGRFLTYNHHAQANIDTLDYATNESTHNLFTSILQAMGEDDQHFGNDHAKHTGPLPGLT